MNICIIVNEYPPDRIAGTAVATQALAWELVRKGIGVHVIVTERAPDSLQFSMEAGVSVIRLSNSSIPVMRWLLRILKIRKIVGQIVPDILHGQSISCGLYARIAAWRRTIPYIVTIHGYDIYEASRIQKKTEIKWSLSGAEGITATAKHIAEEAQKIIGGSYIHIIPSGYTPSPAHINPRRQKKSAFAEKEIQLMTIARLIPVKGLDILLQAVQRLNNVRLWIAGEGYLKSMLENISIELNISEKVTFLGLLDRKDIFDRMYASDIFILPSRSEPFGICLLEAMDAGLPIVATRVGGIPEIVGDENGILVPPEDPAALASAIDSLMNDSCRRAEMSKRNRRKAAQYRWENLINDYQTIYASIMK